MQIGHCVYQGVYARVQGVEVARVYAKLKTLDWVPRPGHFGKRRGFEDILSSLHDSLRFWFACEFSALRRPLCGH